MEGKYYHFIKVNISGIVDYTHAIMIAGKLDNIGIAMQLKFRYGTIPTDVSTYEPYNYLVSQDSSYILYAEIARTDNMIKENNTNIWYIGLKNEDVEDHNISLNISVVQIKAFNTNPMVDAVSAGNWIFYLYRITLQKTNITITSTSNGGEIPLIKYMDSEYENSDKYRCPTDDFGYIYDPENLPTNVPRGLICIGIRNNDLSNSWKYSTNVTLQEESITPSTDDLVLLKYFDLIALILSCITFGLIVGGFIGWFAQRKRDRKNFRHENMM